MNRNYKNTRTHGESMIRNAEPADISRIAEMQICGWRYAYRGLISDYELFSERQVGRAIRVMEKHFETTQIVVFEDETEAVLKGFAMHGHSRDKDSDHTYEIQAMNVQPEFTRQGIGNILVEYVSDHAWELGDRRLSVWVLDGNTIGISFYRKQGFVEDGKSLLIERWNRSEIRMIKDLGSFR